MNATIPPSLTNWQELLLAALDIADASTVWVDVEQKRAYFEAWYVTQGGVAVRWNQVEPLLAKGWLSVSQSGMADITPAGKAALHSVRGY